MSTVKRYPWVSNPDHYRDERTVDPASPLSAVETRLLACAFPDQTTPELPGETLRALYPEFVTYGGNGTQIEELAEFLVSDEKSVYPRKGKPVGVHECNVLCELSSIQEGYLSFTYHVQSLLRVDESSPHNYVKKNIDTLAQEAAYGWPDEGIPGLRWGTPSSFVSYMMMALAWDGIPDKPTLNTPTPMAFRDNVKRVHEAWSEDLTNQVHSSCSQK